MNIIRYTPDWKRTVATILTFGAFWGFAEATLGFALHAVQRVLPLPNLSGAVMFPVALFFMVASIRTTGKPGAAMGAAIVAAAIKASSLALPVVRFAFVRSPVLAILAEGGIVTIGAAVGLMPFLTGASENGTRRTSVVRQAVAVFLTALAISAAWRGAFLGLNVVLGITGGILSKPTAVLLRFVSVESVWNAVVIATGIAVVTLTKRPESTRGVETGLQPRSAVSSALIGTSWLAKPIVVTFALLLAIASEWGVAYIPI